MHLHLLCALQSRYKAELRQSTVFADCAREEGRSADAFDARAEYAEERIKQCAEKIKYIRNEGKSSRHDKLGVLQLFQSVVNLRCKGAMKALKMLVTNRGS